MGEYTKCAWCGRTIEKNRWNKFVSHNTMGLAGRQKNSYCSKKCQLEAESSEGGSNNVNQERVFFSKDFSENSDSDEKEVARQIALEKEKRETKLDDISKISFNSDVDEIQESLNYLVTIGVISTEKDIRIAIVEKMEFGIMKLKNAGFINEANFFEGKRESIRPKSFKEKTSNTVGAISGFMSKMKRKK